MSGGDFGEHLADMAADGYDLDAPVPNRPVRAIAQFHTITPDDWARQLQMARERRAQAHKRITEALDKHQRV